MKAATSIQMHGAAPNIIVYPLTREMRIFIARWESPLSPIDVTYLLKDMVAEDMMVAIREVPRIGPGNLAAAEEIAAELNIGDETA